MLTPHASNITGNHGVCSVAGTDERSASVPEKVEYIWASDNGNVSHAISDGGEGKLSLCGVWGKFYPALSTGRHRKRCEQKLGDLVARERLP